MENLILEINKYLDEKDSAMMQMNPIKMAESYPQMGLEADTAYFRGKRHGACEVIGAITKMISTYSEEK